ncbi:hypothetical protein SAMN05880501_11815 [Ureibacillus xyleni]|uniref:Uncharacterized protein n=1 Tax=Ureibacillus xyleni TaxID=614648 RepID=A0A285TR65_9BACL|nr:hypothetical protein [Ureibacillus xyleni]SOC25075.1 hypothetical protein SAMN05880501_11815 [Ureibacillus xyleni]
MKFITLLIVLGFTILFAYDYFPNAPHVVHLPKSFIAFLILGLILIGLLFKRNRKVDDKAVFKWKVFITVYIIFLMVVFTLLGGNSASGISFKNSFFWVVLLLAVVDIFSHFRKIKNSQ